ncbi:S41 family peptidase [uncultured Rhodospira sp.]|uniref:S41 family peptidase n=1 Tax=uncultured Rhodospira sp. TaxID=1936189 RepID=UPI0026149421|nr:S41 family peptidase [uncultured Rhodospira sp.]
MSRLARPVSWLLVLVGLILAGLFLAACAPPRALPPTPGSPSTDARPIPPEPFTREQAQRLFTHGYVAVSSRYIEPVDMATFVSAGLHGLTRIDPALDFGIRDGVLALSRDDQPVAALPTPADGRGSDWARLSIDAIQAARAVSPPLAAADAEAVYDALFDAALASLDPFSRYAGAEEARLNRGTRNGFGGIGILFEIDETDAVMVREVVADGPADRAGLKAGDRIVAVEDVPFTRPTNQTVRALLRGPVGVPVRLTIRRDSLVEVTVERGLIVMPTVELVRQDGIAVLRLSSFNQATAEAVADAVREARHWGDTRGLIIDMRGNPGGLLDQSVTVADLFLDEGTIVSTRGRHPEARQYYSATRGDIAGGLPIVVLMDGESASAAEIVAAALQDGGRAVVIGTTSYGKGTVQTVVQLPNGGEITLTWSRFHSPSGYVLHGLGVPPVACTSGRARRTEPAMVERVLADVRGHADTIARRLSSWRHTAFEDTERRLRLRALCPAEHHEPDGLDEVVARRLIRDPGLYARAIGLVGANAAYR